MATDYLTRAYDLMKEPTLSEAYYNSAYRTVHLPTGFSPFLIRTLLREDSQAFLDLAYWPGIEVGFNKSSEIRLFVEKYSFP